jgi:dTDP-4-dehydrorhamnose reductase
LVLGESRLVGEAGTVKIAIVGTGGRLGAALARAWSATDDVLPFPRAEIDLAMPGSAEAALEPLDFDVLINCAALTNVDYCETHEAESMRINAEAVREIGALCARKGKRCVHVSTDYVFDGELDRPYVETDAARAISIYGESKLQGEHALLATSDAHLAIRVSWVFGPDRPSFIDGILKRALEHDHADAIGDKWSSPSFTLDLAEMLYPLLQEIPQGGILHACNTGGCTWREYGEFALQCAARAGVPLKTTEVKSLPMAGMKAFVARRPVHTVLSSERLAQLTGRTPRPWQEAVDAFVRDYAVTRLLAAESGIA